MSDTVMSSSVITVKRLRTGRTRTRISFFGKGKEFSPFRSVHIGSECLPPSLKFLRNEAHHLPVSSIDVNNAWIYTSALPYAFVVWCFIKHKNKCFISVALQPNAALGRRIVKVHRCHTIRYPHPHLVRLF